MSIVLDTPSDMDFFQILRCAKMLQLQVRTGLKYSRGSVWKYSKTTWGFTGNLKTVRDKMAVTVEYMQQAKEKGVILSSSDAAAIIEADWNHYKKYVAQVVKE